MASATLRDKQYGEIKASRREQAGKKGLYVSVRADKSLKIQLALSIRGRGRPHGNNVRKYPPTEHVKNATLTFLVIDTSACKPETDLLFVRTIFSMVFAHICFLNK